MRPSDRFGRAPAPPRASTRCASAPIPRFGRVSVGPACFLSLRSSREAEAAFQPDHRETGLRRLAALVALVHPRPSQRLILVLDRQDAEADGKFLFERELLQPMAALGADVLV